MKFQLFGLLVILVIIISVSPALSADLYVPADFYSIKEALVHSVPGDQIKISPGTYFEINLAVPPGVTLSGLGESPDEVILDAQGRGRIMLCESLESTTIIQNLTFTNGSATGDAVYDQSGGAILINNSSLRLHNCRFINNSADGHGGAIRCSHAMPQILNCYFEGNQALAGGGGAVDCSYDSRPILQNSFFKNNEALWGGALSCRANSSPILYQCDFDQNTASGELAYGGAVMADLESQPTFNFCTFYGNMARYGGALASFQRAQTNLENCTVVGNTSQFFGAGMLCIDSSPTVNHSIFAFQNGSAIACNDESLPIINCTDIFGNSGGDWYGTIEPQAQINGNINLDPLFCNPDPGVNFRFTLAPDSPCNETREQCGLLGAWDAGCDATAINVYNFESEWIQNVAHISWRISNRTTDVYFMLKRSFADDPSNKTSIPFQILNLENFLAIDTDLKSKPGQNLLYSLYQVQKDDTLVLIKEVLLGGSENLHPLRINDVWPNPFNPRTSLRFEIATKRNVTVMVHNIRGQKVRTLANETFSAGQHELVWNGKDDFGRQVESGAYFITVQADELVNSIKVLLLK